jgi:pimeloyl-ACP methyl ester carboxylesterase
VNIRFYRWTKRIVIGIAVATGLILFVVLPLAGSYMITNTHFRYPEHGPQTPAEVGLSVTPVTFYSSDGIELRGWWSPGNRMKAVIIFCHGWNRSRLELLERAAEANRQGYGVLLFDFRNHGQSGLAYTTLGIQESKDVCAASQLVRERAGRRPQVLWGVSMGASTAILGAHRCSAFRAIIADSSFLSFRETVAHHLNLFLHLPPFPIADLIVELTSLRMRMNPDDGNVEAAVESLTNVPILFIAGEKDRRMPPSLAQRLRDASTNPQSEMLLVPGAGHGEAFSTNKKLYLDTVFAFLSRAVPFSAGPGDRS